MVIFSMYNPVDILLIVLDLFLCVSFLPYLFFFLVFPTNWMNEKLGNLIEDIEIMQKKLINSKTENEISN